MERTLLRHETFEKDGQVFRKYKTGPLEANPNYSVAKDGSIRHTHPQFRGSKKDRRRLKKAMQAGMAADLPVDHAELDAERETLQEHDQLMDVRSQKWVDTPFIGCSLAELQSQMPIFIRAARKEAK